MIVERISNEISLRATFLLLSIHFDKDVKVLKEENVRNDDLVAVEDLLSQSLKGFHFAFDRADIKLAMGAPLNGVLDFSKEDNAKVQEIFFEFVKRKGIQAKKDFLNVLPVLERELVIKTYFNILENTVKKCGKSVH